MSFRTIAQLQHVEWPTYGSTPLYDRSSVSALQSDIRTVARVWFEHDVHDSIAEFVSQYPLKYVDFGPHDEYSGSTRYQMPQLVRLFLLKEIHGWDHETALLTFLRQRPELRLRSRFRAYAGSIDSMAQLAPAIHDRTPRDNRNGGSNDPDQGPGCGSHSSTRTRPKAQLSKR